MQFKKYVLNTKLVYILILLSFFIFSQTKTYAQNSLVFNVTGQPPLNTTKHDGFMDVVTREALRRIGYKLIINRQPAERGLRSVNKGILDGEMSRVKGINKIYPNLIRVEEKIMNWDFVVFSKKEIPLDSGWSALKNKNVSFINGWKILEKNVPQSARVTKTKNSDQLFNLVKKNRTDFVIYEHWGGRFVIKRLGLNDIKKREPALASKEMYIYLHKKHSALIPKLSAALSEMKKNGSYKKLEEKFLIDDGNGL